jgi:hypothetical protein
MAFTALFQRPSSSESNWSHFSDDQAAWSLLSGIPRHENSTEYLLGSIEIITRNMKHYIVFGMVVVGMFAGGCTSTSFTEYRGQGVLEGKGGTVRKVEGIEFWENGEPDRKYRILGVIDDSRGDSIFIPVKDSTIAKVARKRGGDAVILAVADREFSGFDNYGNAHYRRKTKMVVVKYVE